MKLIKVTQQDQSNEKEQVEIICESEDKFVLKMEAEKIGLQNGLGEINWLNWSRPTMGNNRLGEPTKEKLTLSERSALYICE